MSEIQAPAAGVVLALMAQFRIFTSFKMRDKPFGLDSSTVDNKAGKIRQFN